MTVLECKLNVKIVARSLRNGLNPLPKRHPLSLENHKRDFVTEVGQPTDKRKLIGRNLRDAVSASVAEA